MKISTIVEFLLNSILQYNNSEQNERVVYLNNGDDFQIQLFNPERTTIGAEVYVNGEKLSGILVLKPGERIWLEENVEIAQWHSAQYHWGYRVS